jgi:hypothetical protein
VNNLLTSFDPSKKAIVPGTDLNTMYRLNATLPSVVNRMQSLGVKFISYKDAGMPQQLFASRRISVRLDSPIAWVGQAGNCHVAATASRTAFPSSLTAQQRQNAPYFAFAEQHQRQRPFPDGINNYYMRSVPTIVGASTAGRDRQTTSARSSADRRSKATLRRTSRTRACTTGTSLSKKR